MRFEKYYDYLLVFILYLIIFWNNALKPFFSVDFVPSTFFDMAKNLQVSGFTSTLYLLDFFEYLLSLLKIQQLIFSLSILLFIFVSYFYIKRIITRNPLIFAIVFFFNPFIYSRIMTGQLGVVLPYLLLPVYVFYLLDFFKNPNSKKLVKLSFVHTLIGSFSPHFFVLNLLLFVLASFWLYFYKNKNFSLKKYAMMFLVFVLLLMLFNAYWIQAFLSNSVFSDIDESHKDFFAPKHSTGVSTVAKSIGMWGFWREIGYISTYKTLPLWLWYSLTAVLFGLMFAGYYTNYKDRESKFFYSLWWIGLVFAIGISHPYIKPVFDFLFEHVPFFKAFRDSNKFVVFVALSYAYLCPKGVLWIRDKLKKLRTAWSALASYSVLLLFIMLILLYTYPLVGLWGQIETTEYPPSYNKTNQFLKQQNLTGHVIYLPWEAYLTYNWTKEISSDGRIVVPINKVIEPLVLVSPGKWSAGNNIQSGIGKCIKNQSISCLENFGVQYVLKDECAYYPNNYSWVNATKVHENGCLQVYALQNKVSVNRSIKFPARFIIGALISFAALLFVMCYLSGNKLHPRNLL